MIRIRVGQTYPLNALGERTLIEWTRSLIQRCYKQPIPLDTELSIYPYTLTVVSLINSTAQIKWLVSAKPQITFLYMQAFYLHSEPLHSPSTNTTQVFMYTSTIDWGSDKSVASLIQPPRLNQVMHYIFPRQIF